MSIDSNSLKKLIYKYQLNNKNSFYEIELFFNKKINSYSKRSFYSDIKEDITLHLIEIITKINLKNFNNDKALFKYINKSLDFKFIDINKSFCDYENNSINYDFDFYDLYYSFDTLQYNYYDPKLDIKLITSNLDKREREVLILKYKYNYKFTEIGEKLHLSKQNVYYIHKKALSKLKKELI